MEGHRPNTRICVSLILQLAMRNAVFPFVLGLMLVSSSVALADDVLPTNEVTTRVVVRAGPSSQTGDIGSLREGEQAELLGSVPNWYRVRLANGTEGFVAKRWTRVVSAPGQPPPSFTLDVVDVGTGLGILLRGADFTMVYDAGSNDDVALGANNRMLAYIKTVAPALKVIDHVILSHPHRDHVQLLPDLFEAYQVREVWDSGVLNPICAYRAFLVAVRDKPGVQYHTAAQNFGTQDFSFTAPECTEVVHLTHASSISMESPVHLGQGASMNFLYVDGALHADKDFNENSLVVRLDLGGTRVLLMGDAEAGARQDPSTPPKQNSIEGSLLACCASELSAKVLVVGHHGSKTSSRRAFLDRVGASVFIVSAGPTKYGSVVLPDQEVINELASRGRVFRTDLNDRTCGQNSAKIGPDADGKPGGCDNVRVLIPSSGDLQVDYWRGAD
jgi:beta-lactamase superfamily II metal-dependent hydrolase